MFIFIQDNISHKRRLNSSRWSFENIGFLVYLNENIPTICPGHNYQEGILKHPYYGSQKVIEDLQQLPGWVDGLVTLNDKDIKYIRDQNDQICQIIHETDISLEKDNQIFNINLFQNKVNQTITHGV